MPQRTGRPVQSWAVDAAWPATFARRAAAVAAPAVIAAVWIVRVGIHLSGGGEGPAATVFDESSRAFGIAALVLGCGALPIGLFVGRRLAPARFARDLRAAHRTIALWSLVALGLHLVTLLGASSLSPSVARLVVPFLWPYRETGTALGVLGAWVLLLLGLSYFARRQLGARRWRIAHRFIAAGLALAILHTIAGG